LDSPLWRQPKIRLKKVRGRQQLKEKLATPTSICEFRAEKEKTDPELRKACLRVRGQPDSRDSLDRKGQQGRQDQPVERS
jgi:hypothetical protein